MRLVNIMLPLFEILIAHYSYGQNQLKTTLNRWLLNSPENIEILSGLRNGPVI